MRVIKTIPDLNVNIRGADNHKISAVLLVTTGGVTTTTTGEVIVIFQQDTCHGKNKPSILLLRLSTTRK